MALHWRERLMASDPDLARFRMGARAALSTALTPLLLSLAGKFVPVPPTAVVLGAAMAMLATVFATDANARDRARTTAMLVLPAVFALIAGTLVAPYPRLSVAAFVVTVFVAVFVRRYGPRGTAIGMMLFNAFFFALFFRAQVHELPVLIASTIFAVGVGFVVRFAILPDRPKQIVRRSLESLKALTSLTLFDLSRALTSPEVEREERRVRRTLAQLNQTALTLESEIDSFGVDDLPEPKVRLRARIFALEVAAGRLTASIRELTRIADLSREASGRLSEALIEGARGVRGDVTAADAARVLANNATQSSGRDSLTTLLLSRAAIALDELLLSASGVPPGENTFAHAVAAAPLPSVSSPGLNPSTRQAIQAAIAAAVAMVLGRWISPDRWLWAVLAAFIVLTAASTTEEIIVRAWHRIAGTVVGVLLGMLLAAAVHGHPRVELGLLFVCVFLAFHSLKGNYSLMVMWITAVLALLYGLLGRYTPGLLWLRIEETFAGAIVGAIVAALILPTRTQSKVSASLCQVLRLFSELMRKMGAGTKSVVLQPEARRLDSQLQELRTAAEPLARNVFSPGNQTAAMVYAASGLVFYARQLSAPEWNDALPQDVRANAEVLAQNADALLRKLSGNQKASFEDTTGLRERLRQLATATAASNGQAALTAIWFRRMDELLSEMCRMVAKSA